MSNHQRNKTFKLVFSNHGGELHVNFIKEGQRQGTTCWHTHPALRSCHQSRQSAPDQHLQQQPRQCPLFFILAYTGTQSGQEKKIWINSQDQVRWVPSLSTTARLNTNSTYQAHVAFPQHDNTLQSNKQKDWAYPDASLPEKNKRGNDVWSSPWCVGIRCAHCSSTKLRPWSSMALPLPVQPNIG